MGERSILTQRRQGAEKCTACTGGPACSSAPPRLCERLPTRPRETGRERKRDEDFDHEIRLAQQATPDPLRLMENAARVHWRAAAWLLERTRPEQFARQPANTARDYQVEAALGMLLEAALAATAPAERAKLYEQIEPTVSQALQYCFPQLGPGGNLKKSRLPATPLANEASCVALRQAIAASRARAEAAAEPGEPPVEFVSATALFNEPPATLPMPALRSAAPPLSPKIDEATADDTTLKGATQPKAPLSQSPIPDHQSPTTPLSPKTHEATASDTTLSDTISESATAIAGLDQNEQTLLWNQRLRHRAVMKRRRSEREAAKREKAAKKRAAASRRRNAA